MITSPLAPKQFPALPAIDGVELITYPCNIKYKNRDDMLVAVLTEGTEAAGVFTTSTTASANVLWGRKAIHKHEARVLVVNAGNANAFNGKYGMETIHLITERCAQLWNCNTYSVFPCATGVIGQAMPNDKILSCLDLMAKSPNHASWEQAAEAIKTTDTFAKGATANVTLGGKKVTITGIAKGSGMIAPNMATMLAYVFTDAAIEGSILQQLLEESVETTFNAITVDSDTSTSDTLYLFATGKAKNPVISSSTHPDLQAFKAALHQVMLSLAHQVVKDGEGATKFIEITVDGAKDAASAKTIGLAIANSPLVKTAITGEDANWGRIIMAVGKSGEPINTAHISISVGGHIIVAQGELYSNYDETPVTAHMKTSDIKIEVNVGNVGKGKATVWTCNLTHAYIDINGNYRS
jgi:glutamate N-acetyltransferase/amino-acid N-acetyltransferase